jgi:hypothetical protein
VYVKDVAYTAHGAATQLTLGDTLVANISFNNRLQPVRMRLGSAAGTGAAHTRVSTTESIAATRSPPSTFHVQPVLAPGRDRTHPVLRQVIRQLHPGVAKKHRHRRPLPQREIQTGKSQRVSIEN